MPKQMNRGIMKVTEPKFQAVAPTTTASESPVVRPAAPVERVSKAETEAVASTIAQVQRSLPADRAARIEQIAQAVKKGQYQPNAQQIANRIVEQAELEARLRAALNKP
ncbi:MAG: flagellar biosynthesis anti-sigma factor FlgM [Myxococcaceae bacterium]|nr:flagellar biosynthesis anti-sigma factor FlgM [Myxococcaceae bacterium]